MARAGLTSKSRRVAYVATLVLLLQSFLTAWAMGAMPMQALDAFGNPICITGTDISGKAPAGDHSSMPNCCAMGCGQASVVVAPPTGAVIAVALPVPLSDRPSALDAPVQLEEADHDPGSPRAPPLTA